ERVQLGAGRAERPGEGRVAAEGGGHAAGRGERGLEAAELQGERVGPGRQPGGLRAERGGRGGPEAAPEQAADLRGARARPADRRAPLLVLEPGRQRPRPVGPVEDPELCLCGGCAAGGGGGGRLGRAPGEREPLRRAVQRVVRGAEVAGAGQRGGGGGAEAAAQRVAGWKDVGRETARHDVDEGVADQAHPPEEDVAVAADLRADGRSELEGEDGLRQAVAVDGRERDARDPPGGDARDGDGRAGADALRVGQQDVDAVGGPQRALNDVEIEDRQAERDQAEDDQRAGDGAAVLAAVRRHRNLRGSPARAAGPPRLADRRMLRLGHIQYSSCVPVHALLLGRGVPAGIELRAGVPAVLNAELRAGQVDVAPCSSIEFARQADRYRLLPGLVIGSAGPVQSILLEGAAALEDLDGREVALPTASATSVVLLRILLELRLGVRPHYRWFDQSEEADPVGAGAAAALWIGDHAMRRAERSGRP